MAHYPPRYSDTETIVYHVAPDDRDGDGPARRSLQNVPLGISVPRRDLDQREVGPLARLYASPSQSSMPRARAPPSVASSRPVAPSMP